MKKLEWSIGEKGADEVIKLNLVMMDKLVQELDTCCANPVCTYPISNIRMERYAVPEFGEVCATCYGMYQALTNMNPHLSRPDYFKNLHTAYLNELREFQNRRKKMGD